MTMYIIVDDPDVFLGLNFDFQRYAQPFDIAGGMTVISTMN